MLDFIELSKLLEDLGNDQILRHNSIKLIRDLAAKEVSVNVEGPQIYSTAASQQQQHMCLSPCNKNNKVRSPSQISTLRGHVDIECCYCFHKQKALEQKQGK